MKNSRFHAYLGQRCVHLRFSLCSCLSLRSSLHSLSHSRNAVQVPLPDEDARVHILQKKIWRLVDNLSNAVAPRAHKRSGSHNGYRKPPSPTASSSKVPCVPREWLDPNYVSCPPPWKPEAAGMTVEQRNHWVIASFLCTCAVGAWRILFLTARPTVALLINNPLVPCICGENS